MNVVENPSVVRREPHNTGEETVLTARPEAIAFTPQ